ncbi:MAG: hypothetical protein QM589_07900 [Thermomicrobiales bacterium]
MTTTEHYAFWHTRSHNLMDEFDSIDEAVDILESAVRREGPGFLTNTHLVMFDETGNEHLVAQGEAILVAVKRIAAEEHCAAVARLRKVG